MILSQALQRVARLFPERTAIIFEGCRQNYRELRSRVGRLAGGLHSLGLGRGDRVAVLMLNCPEFIETTFACFEAGAVIVPLNTRLAAEELAFIINDADCAALITDDALRPTVAAFRPHLHSVRSYVVTGEAEGFISYEGLAAREAEPHRAAPVSEDDLAGIFYTSGTTGVPKGVMLSHRNLWMNSLHTIVALSIGPEETFLHAAPMFHLADFPAILNTTLTGGAHAMLKRFDPQALVETIERDHVTNVLLVPTMINFMVSHPDLGRHDLSSLKWVFYGASPMPLDLLKRAMAALPGCAFIQGYGQSESGPLLTVLSAADHVADGPEQITRRLKSCGRPIIGVEVEIFDDQDRPVQPDQVGEVVARGPNVMLGYWKRPDETERALRGGWLRTGDLATVDEDGYIYLVDRKKDMIITGGENVYSTEVEQVIYAHPAVREAAVIGVPDSQWGEAVKAVVTLRPDASLTEAELIAFCATHLGGYKVPKSVDILEGELPKSGTGKILKKELREKYWVGYERRVN